MGGYGWVGTFQLTLVATAGPKSGAEATGRLVLDTVPDSVKAYRKRHYSHWQSLTWFGRFEGTTDVPLAVARGRWRTAGNRSESLRAAGGPRIRIGPALGGNHYWQQGSSSDGLLRDHPGALARHVPRELLWHWLLVSGHVVV